MSLFYSKCPCMGYIIPRDIFLVKLKMKSFRVSSIKLSDQWIFRGTIWWGGYAQPHRAADIPLNCAMVFKPNFSTISVQLTFRIEMQFALPIVSDICHDFSRHVCSAFNALKEDEEGCLKLVVLDFFAYKIAYIFYCESCQRTFLATFPNGRHVCFPTYADTAISPEQLCLFFLD